MGNFHDYPVCGKAEDYDGRMQQNKGTHIMVARKHREKKMSAFPPSSPIIPFGQPDYKMVAAFIQGRPFFLS